MRRLGLITGLAAALCIVGGVAYAGYYTGPNGPSSGVVLEIGGATVDNSHPIPVSVGGAVTTQSGATILATGIYQQVLPANATRKGCAIFNISSHAMTVYFGTANTPSASNAFPLPAGTPISCNPGGIVLTDKVQIAGTIGDGVVFAEQN